MNPQYETLAKCLLPEHICQGTGTWHTRLSKIINKKNKYYY